MNCVSLKRALLAAKVGLLGVLASGAAQLSAAVFPDGVNLQPSYYNNGNVNFGWSLMNQYPNIGTVRIEIEPDKVDQAKTWISEARANGKTVVATYHKYTVLGSDSTTELNNAANWWATNYGTLAQSGAFTINLMNEWGSHSITSNDYANAYNTAIGIVRGVYNGPIIIDAPGWGQETHTAANAVKGTGGVKINDPNIILSAHVYPNGWNQGLNHTFQNSDLDDLASAGRPCIIGEFGDSPSGSADWSGMVDHAKSLGFAVIGWAWNGDGGSMNMVTPSWSSNATASSFSPSGYFNTIYSKLSASANIAVTGVTVAPSAIGVTIGGTSTLTATVTPANATNRNVTWSSSNTSVATVDASGTVTGVAAGTATITAKTVDGGFTATSTVTVSTSGGGGNLALNKPVTVSSTEANSTNVAANAVDGNTTTRWSSAYADPQWITVDLQSAYNISGVTLRWEAASAAAYRIDVSNDGTNWTTIVTRSNQPAGPRTDTLTGLTGTGRYVRMYGTPRNTQWGYSLYEFEVYGTASQNVAVAGVSVTPGSATLTSAGQTVALTASVIPSNATDQAVSFTSSAPAVATVSASGVVTAVANGTATITATTHDGGYTATSTITVSIASNNGSNLALNKPVSVSSTEANYGNVAANAVDGNTSTRWSSTYSDPQWITVDLQGTYAISGVTLLWETASASDYHVDVSADGTNWTTVATRTAQPAGPRTDTITGLSATGRYVRMYATARNTQWGDSLYEFQVFGTAAQNVPVSGVAVSPTSSSLAVGQTAQLTAAVSPANASNSSVTWSSSAPGIATVNASGLVTAVAAGSATITAKTVDGGYTAAATVTVTSSNVAVTGVSVSPTSANLTVGQTLALTTTVSPSNASNRSVSYASNNAAVATVNAQGVITAVAAGQALITATTTDSGFQASCAVTVSSSGGGGGLSTVAVGYTITSDWGTGYSTNITLTNNGTTAVQGWTVTFTLPAGDTMSNLWNGTYTTSGQTVTVTNVDYNAAINPGAAVSFGYNANGPSGTPTDFVVTSPSGSGTSGGTTSGGTTSGSGSTGGTTGGSATDYYYPQGTSVDQLKTQSSALSPSQVKAMLFTYIDRNWAAISAYTGQTDKTKVYALFLGFATRESTMNAGVETATDGGFLGDPAHAFGPIQTAITAFANGPSSFVPEDDVPELYQYSLTEPNFYDPGISVHMGIRKFLHFIKQAKSYNLTGIDVIRNALKGLNTGWANPENNPQYYADYPDEIGAMARWYLQNNHLYDDTITWTNNPSTNRTDPWNWW